MGELAETDDLFPGQVSPVGYEPAIDSFDAAGRIADILAGIEDGHQLWIGDFLIWARAEYGEDYTQLIPEGKADTWRQYLWVAERVPMAIREKIGGYTRCRTIARLSLEDQQAIADTFPTDGTTRQLRELVQPDSGNPDPEPDTPKLTWGQIKAELDAQIDDDETVSLTVGSAATKILLYRCGEGWLGEGWIDHDRAEPCRITGERLKE